LTSWDPEGLGQVLVGLFLMVFSILKMGISLLSINTVVFLFMILLGMLFTYSVVVIIGALAFVFVKSFSLFTLFTSLMDMARYPSTIYEYGMKFFVSFVIPVSVASTMPALALITGLGFWEVVYVTLPVLGFFVFSLLFWGYAMKKYSSAGG